MQLFIASGNQNIACLTCIIGMPPTSSFFGIGKRSVYKIVNEDLDEFADPSTLSGNDETAAVDASRHLVLKLYSTYKTHGQNLDDLRLKFETHGE